MGPSDSKAGMTRLAAAVAAGKPIARDGC